MGSVKLSIDVLMGSSPAGTIGLEGQPASSPSCLASCDDHTLLNFMILLDKALVC